MLNSTEIKKLVEEKELISGYVDFEKQLQPAGFDLSLQEIHTYLEKGAVDFTNQERITAETRKIDPDQNGWYQLTPGCYMIIYNETVKMPLDTVALARSRSSMLRNAATIETALWDPGYKGKSSSLLIVHNPHGLKLKQNARVAQLIFFKTEELKTGYSGIYQNERIKKES